MAPWVRTQQPVMQAAREALRVVEPVTPAPLVLPLLEPAGGVPVASPRQAA